MAYVHYADIFNDQLKPLRRALDALCRHRSYIDYADDLATLRGVESSLRMELMEQKETAINLQNKLQCDLKTISGTLQAERNGFLAKLFAEREASAKAQKELQNIIRETFRIFQALQTENGRLLSKLQTTQSTEGTLYVRQYYHDKQWFIDITSRSVINRDASDTQELPCLPDLGAEILAIPDWPFTSHNSGPSPYTHSYSQSVNKHRDSNPRTTGAVSVHAFEAFPVSKDSVHQVDISSHPKSFQINLLSQPEDIITEVQNRSQAALAYKVMQAPVGQNLDSQTLSLSQHDSSAALKRPRRLLKMASTPTLWKKANKHLSGGDGQGVGISAAARGQVGCNILPETPPETLDATTGAEQNIAEDRKVLTQRWPHSWRIFSS